MELNKLISKLKSNTDSSSLAALRILFGIIMFIEAIIILIPSKSAANKTPIDVYFKSSHFHFPYDGFEWLPLFPETGIYCICFALGLSGIMVAVGFLYRLSTIVLFLSWGYFYLVEMTRTYWMSHYYLILLISFLMIFIPGACSYSLDNKIFKRDETKVPYIYIFLIRTQLIICYFFAGVAKLNADWLLDAEPVGYFLYQAGLNESSFINTKYLAYFLSWSGACFDIFVGFMLIYKRTMFIGFIFVLLFHLFNHFILFDDLGMFPFVGIATSTIFLRSTWLSSLVKFFTKKKPERSNNIKLFILKYPSVNISFVFIWIIIQMLVPVRHFFIEKDNRITFEGLSFSWRLKADVYRTNLAKIQIKNDQLFQDLREIKIINWEVWNKENILYRQIDQNTDWGKLPEIIVLSEPQIGDRIIYNGNTNDNEKLTKGKIENIWKSIYGRKPEVIRPTISLNDFIQQGVRKAYQSTNDNLAKLSNNELLNYVLKNHGITGNKKAMPLIRTINPFELINVECKYNNLYLIEDANLIDIKNKVYKLKNANWKSNLRSICDLDYAYIHKNDSPVVKYTFKDGFRYQLPRLVITDTYESNKTYIHWDIKKSISMSKAMHMSINPFLMKRYVDYIKPIIKENLNLEPAIYVQTSVSLNGRPFQSNIDTSKDIAAVDVKLFSHNDWILGIKEKRISNKNKLPGFLSY